MAGEKTISLRVSENFDRELRVAAALTDQNRSELIREALRRHMAELSSRFDPQSKALVRGGTDGLQKT